MKRTLHLSNNVDTGFSYAIDWVERAAGYRGEKSAVILVPHQEVAIRLRKILAGRGSTFINVHFWTPEVLRSQFLRLALLVTDIPEVTIASREELQLVLSAVAGAFIMEEDNEIPSPLARAIENNPAFLLRVLDLLDSAGLHTRVFESLEEITELTEIFFATLKMQGLWTVSTTDRLLASCPPLTRFEALLIFGFHAGHWPLFPLLMAACRCTEDLAMLFDAPLDCSFDMDSSWIGTWEDVLQIEAIPLEADNEKAVGAEFLAEESTIELARAIALQAAKMVEEGAESVAIAFPGYGVMSREVALALAELQIPHFDAIGHLFSECGKPWKSWCTFQQVQTVQTFAGLLELLPDQGGALTLLQKVFNEALTQDVSICTELARLQYGDTEEVKKLTTFSLLPERGAFADFRDLVVAEFSRLGWWKEIERLQLRQRLRHPSSLIVRRKTFLRWLQVVLFEERRQRDPMGDYPYAVIHLLRRDQAALCPWTHVILAGMNVGEWPEPTEENCFLPADVIADFNKQISTTNRATQVQGAFGEGHLVVTQLPCLGPQERSLLQRRDFERLRQTCHLLATTRLKADTEPSLPARPSFWFSKLFYELRGRFPSPEELRTHIPPRQERNSLVNVEEVAEARRVRMDPTLAFGPWEFSAFVTTSSSLAVTDTERILREPAIVWMKTFLGVQPPEDVLSWSATAGIWTHRWLRSICPPGWLAFPDKDSRRNAIFSASEIARSRMEQAGRTLGRPIPIWWNFLWQQARSLALQFSDQLEAFRARFAFVVTEYTFRDLNVTPGFREFLVSGRWDILLCNKMGGSDENTPLAGTSILVVDYKTGTNLKMSISSRDGAQLALYSHAALAWGAERVDATWVSPNTSGDTVHLPFEELKKWEPLVVSLGNLVRSGVFGMRGELRSEFVFGSAMPLATLPIPQDVLEAKWQLTHNPDSWQHPD